MVKNRWVKWFAASLVASSVGVPTAWSYVRAAQHQSAIRIGASMPLTIELARLEQMSQDMILNLNANRKVCAQLDVECSYLQRELSESKSQQEKKKSEMDELRNFLASGQPTYNSGGKCYSRADVESDLARRLDAYEQQRDNLLAKQRLLDSRQQTLRAAIDSVRGYEQQIDKLTVRAASMRDELKLLELAQSAGKVQFENSKLTDAKKVADNLEKRLAVARKLMDGGFANLGEIPVAWIPGRQRNGTTSTSASNRRPPPLATRKL